MGKNANQAEFIMVLMLMVAVSVANVAIYEDIYNDNYPDDNYEYDDEQEVPQLISKIRTTTITSVEYFYDMPRIRYKCPSPCDCSTDLKLIDCSNRNLTKVPIIPCTTLRINLSSNFIAEMKNEDFEECLNVQELILHTNKIERINKNIFAKLRALQSLDLAKNSLTTILPDTFEQSENLKNINFSHNKLNLRASSFLNFPQLEKLQLRGCNIHRLGNEVFHNLSGLVALDLRENEFEALNAEAFGPLVKLQELALPTISRNSVQELCNLLGSIDTISFGNQSISCFVLVSGGTFEQSIIPSNQDFRKGHKTAIVSTPGITESYSASKVTERTITSEGYTITTRKENNKINGKHHESISASAINKILIGIILFAVFGLTVGIIRRKDICGLRTKICRTRRPASTDLIKHTDAAPLNNV